MLGTNSFLFLVPDLETSVWLGCSRETGSDTVMRLILYCSIILLLKSDVLGEKCKLSSGKDGYCREKDDCPKSREKGDCKNEFICCEDSGKSVLKCKEYGKLVYSVHYGAALSARTLTHNVSQCNIEAVPLVVGGVKAKAKEFPHMVAIGYGNDVKSAKWMCGGSLISEKFVLTAAHCSQSQGSGPAKFVRMGALNLGNVESNVQDFTIEKIINHPRFKPPARYNDIALFKLSRSVITDEYARPACLHTHPDESDLKKSVATGWGKLQYSASEGSPDLMKVTLNYIDYSTCNSSYSRDIAKALPKGIISSQLCAGELKGGKDTCQGDSGGPLQIEQNDPYCTYSIIGITSFGKFCGYKNSPAVYTKVSYYIPWIESIVWP